MLRSSIRISRKNSEHKPFISKDCPGYYLPGLRVKSYINALTALKQCHGSNSSWREYGVFLPRRMLFSFDIRCSALITCGRKRKHMTDNDMAVKKLGSEKAAFGQRSDVLT